MLLVGYSSGRKFLTRVFSAKSLLPVESVATDERWLKLYAGDDSVLSRKLALATDDA